MDGLPNETAAAMILSDSTATAAGGLAWICCLLAVLMNLLVVCGNLFVLYILISQKSLHTATNSIVLSLTLSDFLLGLIILPFSILQEYSHAWMFGEVWCKMWLALDVLLSTASIYNLLAISFDRYMAVRQPIKYRFISSNRMTKITIAIVWLISAALALPPLVYDHFGVVELLSTTNSNRSGGGGGGECTPMTSNDWYILFSALVSFILPMFFMITLNLQIFYTVSDSTKLTTKIPPLSSPNSRSGLFSVTATAAASCEDMNRFVMRIHRGGGGGGASATPSLSMSRSHRSLNGITILNNNHTRTNNNCCRKKVSVIQRDCHSVERPSSIVTSSRGSTTIMDDPPHQQQQQHHKGKICFDLPDTMSLKESTNRNHNHNHNHRTWLKRIMEINMANRKQMLIRQKRQSSSSEEERQSFASDPGIIVSDAVKMEPFQQQQRRKQFEKRTTTIMKKPLPPIPMDEDSTEAIETKRAPSIVEKSADKSVWFPAVLISTIFSRRGTSCLSKENSRDSNDSNNASGGNERCSNRRSSQRFLLYPILHLTNYHHNHREQHKTSASSSTGGGSGGGAGSARTELRVARTIGVVVGCFTICWLPFTVIYVLQAFQLCAVGECVPSWLFTLAFWLGYANSALNPLLYAAFSRDFRSAFKHVLDRTSSFRISFRSA